jgi:cytidylate kinase
MATPDPFVIALDGPAASGKSTVGLGVARRLGYAYVDTGLLYRALTWLAMQLGIEPADAARLEQLAGRLELELDPLGRVHRRGQEITERLQQPAVDARVSMVSAHPGVRAALRSVQRDLIRPPGVVMAGRDIGTVIVPEAPLKIWLNASAAERARRRAAQTGEAYAAVLERMLARDRFDGSRSVAPMARAADAVQVDTDGLEPAAVIEHIVNLALARGAKPWTGAAPHPA